MTTRKTGQQQRQGNSKGRATAKARARVMATARTLPGFGWEDVFPGGIGSLDQLDLLRSGPAFEFFFAGDGVADVAEVFAVDQAVDVVVCSVGFDDRFAVCGDSAMDVIGYADVEVS
jgi:hypothetical protein